MGHPPGHDFIHIDNTIWDTFVTIKETFSTIKNILPDSLGGK
jgi:hypothetical protein